LGSVFVIIIIFFKEIKQGHIELLSNKCFSSELSIHQTIWKKKNYHVFHKNMKQHSCFQHW